MERIHKCEVCGRTVRRGVVAPGGRWMHEACYERLKRKEKDQDRVRDEIWLGIKEDGDEGAKHG